MSLQGYLILNISQVCSEIRDFACKNVLPVSLIYA